MKRSLFFLWAFVPLQCGAAPLFQAKASGSQMICEDKTAVPELYDIYKHDPNNPHFTDVAEQGNCTPILTTFSVLKHETLQLPIGPKKIVQVLVTPAPGLSMPPDTGWMMEDDIEPAKN